MENNWEYDYSTLYRGQNTQPSDAGPMPAGETPPPWEPQHRTRSKWPRRLAAGVLALAVCAGTGVAGGYFGAKLAGGPSGSNTTGPVLYQSVERTGTSTGDKGDMSVADVVSLTASSVVEVSTEKLVTDNYFSQRVLSGAGSGVIISEDGYVITNHHVIDGASTITVRLHDKSEYTATVVGSDAATDIAVLKVDATGLSAAVMGDSSTLAVGEEVVAIGNPLGSLGGTVTNGVISALERDITVEGQNMRLLQTNAAISPGNSGGGLFNAQGELIGVVNAKSIEDGSEGIGFAIPINTAREVAEDLINNGYVTGRPALGVTVLNITDAQTAMYYGVNSFGVYIMSVEDGSGAAKAGLKAGDRIVIINNKEVSDTADVTSALQDKAVGDVVSMQISRGGEIMSVEVTLGEKAHPSSQNQAPQSQPQIPQN